MHIKSYDGLDFHFPGPDLYQDEIDSLMSFLHNQIEEIDSYSDKSLFFQNPKIFEGWLDLVRAVKKIKTWEDAEDKTRWEDRTETYVAYLLTLREYYLKYQNLYYTYFGQIRKIIEDYGDKLDEYFISSGAQEILLAEKDLLDLDDVSQFLTDLNSSSFDTRYSVFKTLSKVFDFYSALMDSGLIILMDLNPSIDDFSKAIDDDLREWTFSFGESILKEMKEDLNRHFKEYRTAPYTPELWGRLLDADEDALKMAKRQELATCDDVKQEHWGEDMKTQMDENSNLMQLIYSSCRTDELFDMRKVVDIQRFISLLTPDNLSVFYDIIVRRSLIQCEMFPDLKIQHEEWLNKANEQPDNNESSSLDETAPNLNYFAPTKNLQELLKESWFKEVRTNDKYDEVWTDSFISNLMATQWKDAIAQDWAVTGAREKKTQIKGYVIGLLKDNGVLKGSYDSIAGKVVTDGSRTFSNYMGKGKNQPYANWVSSYVNDLKNK